MIENDVLLIIPHYNNPEGLYKSLASLSEKDPTDVIIVDDGSWLRFDESNIKELLTSVGRVYFLYNASNLGITKSLNKALDFVKGKQQYKFIARLDCGDTNNGSRFIKQKKFLIENPEVLVVGCHARFYSTKTGNIAFHFKPPTTPSQVRKFMYLNSMITHPSFMFRHELLNKITAYPLKYPHAEDYAFLFKVLKIGELANISEFLLNVENNEKGITQTYRNQQIISRLKIIFDNFSLTPFWFIGLIRNLIILITPKNIIDLLKK